MPGKQLTQAAINRVIWLMLRRLGGKFVCSEQDIETPSDDALKIQHYPGDQNFVFTMTKEAEAKESNIILLN